MERELQEEGIRIWLEAASVEKIGELRNKEPPSDSCLGERKQK